MADGSEIITNPEGFDSEVETEKTKFITTFNLSYLDWMKERGVAELGPEAMDEIVGSIRMNYQLKLPTDEVMRFFAIPEKFRKKIESKNYSVREFIKQNDTTHFVLVTDFILTINETPFIPGIEDIMKKNS